MEYTCLVGGRFGKLLKGSNHTLEVSNPSFQLSLFQTNTRWCGNECVGYRNVLSLVNLVMFKMVCDWLVILSWGSCMDRTLEYGHLNSLYPLRMVC